MSGKHMEQTIPAELAVVNPQLEERQQLDNAAFVGYREALITVEQVIERTKEWVRIQAEHLPGLVVAHMRMLARSRL